jgi:hypothetical protein
MADWFLVRIRQVLLDPVCMLTIYPQLLRNFVYKQPNFWSAHMLSLLGLVDSLRFVFSRDLMVAEVRPVLASSPYTPVLDSVLGL